MLLAVLLVQVGSVLHATWNLLATRVRGDARIFVWVYSAISLLFLGPTAVVVLATTDARMDVRWAWVSLVSALWHTAYALALQQSYARSDLNVAYPVARGVGPVLVAVVAVTVLGERLGLGGWLGIGLIALGVAVVSSGALEGSDHARRVAGVRWGLLVAVAIAGYTLWDDHAVNALGVDPVLYYLGTGTWQFLLLTAVTARRWREAVAVGRANLGVATGVALLVPTAYILVLVAMTMAPVALVASLRSTSIAIGSIAAWLLLREPHGGRRLAGAALVVAGVCAMVAA